MVKQVAIVGSDHRAQVEAAVERWIARLEQIRPLESCHLCLRIEPHLLGRKRATIDLAVADGRKEIAVSHVGKLREPSDLYSLISQAFRDANVKLGAFGGAAARTLQP